MNKVIPVDDMIVGATYRGEGRNFDEGVWTGVGIMGDRYKFGRTFPDLELHYDTCIKYGTFKPFEVIVYPYTFAGIFAALQDACRMLIT